MDQLKGRFAFLSLGAAAIAAAIAGCGGGGSTTETVTSTEPAETTGTTTQPAETTGTTTQPAETTEAAPQEAAEPLAGINPPAGSKQLSNDAKGGNVYQRYSTGESPQAVIAAYKGEFTGAGWSILSSGGSGGGWGPYGGSGAGLTAKKGGEYADVQAGGRKGGKTYFEVCAGSGDRAACDQLSNRNNQTQSGGSQSGGQNDNQTNSGGS